jgi:lysyl-tRNA synthetase class 2
MAEQSTPEPLEQDGDEPRRKKLARIRELGFDPYGQRFDDRQWISSIRKRAGEIQFVTDSGQFIDVPTAAAVPNDQFRDWLRQQGAGNLHGPFVRAAGRIMLHRDKGKLVFIDIQDWTGTIQLFIGRGQVGEENWKLIECLDLGDLIGVEGQLKKTQTGELSIFAERVYILCKALEPPPAKHIGMTDPELRQRLRYIDLAYNDGTRDRFLNRSRIVQSIRETLARREFVEIEGPTLHSIAGGAAARPFTTHHNALNLDLFMRIALELHLKRLMVGGMERVFELGRVYRNEGISPRHNPEFTMLEVYQAYGNYESMMELTEAIISGALESTGTGPKVQFGERVIDFATPFRRETYDQLFAGCTGVDPDDARAIADYARSLGIDVSAKHPDVIKSEVFEEKVECQLEGPIFVIDYPASICPLTKRKPGNPNIAERFELFVQGMELANAYTELNDPDLQNQLFLSQLEGMAEEDSMAKMDQDFVRALKNAMPPAGGLGVGIDRLVMLLTNSQTIRDVILFPLLRPEAH